MRKSKIPTLISDAITHGERSGAFLRVKSRRRIFANRQEDDFWGRGTLDIISLRRLAFGRFFVILIVIVFLGRLFQLTVVEGSKNREYADNNRIRLVEVEAERGRIVDRNGKILAESVAEYFLNSNNGKSRISEEQAHELEKAGLAGENFTGGLGNITREVVRVYPFGEVAAHVLGYTSQVQQSDLLKNQSYGTVDFAGRLGVEETYDQILKGVNGRKIIEVDAEGKTISILGENPSRRGQDISLSVDIELSGKVHDVMSSQLAKVKSRSGAVVLTNPQNGEVLALLSFPSFDPSDVGRFVTREEKPLFNRAIGGTYTPGSVLKIASSVAGLESGKITAETEIEDVGEFELGGVKFPNWFYLSYGRRDGTLKIERAIARSNDIFFYRLGERVGLADLRKWAVALGLGQKTGIDLPGESFGIVGDEAWKEANLGEGWFLGDTMHMAIGQGFVTATPLQVNLMTSYIANGGKKVVPHVVSRVEGASGSIELSPSEEKNIGIKASNLEIVRSGMRQACQEKGTAWPFFLSAYPISCKTGTAERTLGNPHAWFTAYAPSDSFEIAITVIVEDGGEGSSVAAPVAKEILDWYFAKGRK